MKTKAGNTKGVIPENKKTFLKKITGDDAKKTKRLTEIQVLTKKFTKKVLKKRKVTQLYQATIGDHREYMFKLI